MTKASEISVAEIVYEEDDDVRLFAARFLGDAKGRAQTGGDGASGGSFKELTSVGLVHWKTESLADLFGWLTELGME